MTAIDNNVAPKIELAIRSINASSGRNVTSVTANSELWEHVGINASFENASGNNNILHASNVNDETRHNITDEVSELSVPKTRSDRLTHTHHNLFQNSRYILLFLMKLDFLHIFEKHFEYYFPRQFKEFLIFLQTYQKKVFNTFRNHKLTFEHKICGIFR